VSQLESPNGNLKNMVWDGLISDYPNLLLQAMMQKRNDIFEGVAQTEAKSTRRISAIL